MPKARSLAEPSFCDDHEVMLVPCNVDFALLDEQGEVVAIVAWLKQDGVMKSYIYAPSEEERDLVPQVSSRLGNEIYALQQAKRLVEYYSLSQIGIMRIDDNRFAGGHSYRVTLNKKGGYGSLRPRTVYHFWGTGASEEPHITDFDELISLMSLPDTLIVLDAEVFVDKTLDEDTKKQLNLSDRVVVWDEYSIAQTAAARKSKE